METHVVTTTRKESEISWNPCCCWNLRDGGVTIGMWTLIFSIAQFGIFGWQTADIKYYKDREANIRLPPDSGSYGQYDIRYPGYYERYYESPQERWYTGLFVIQILALIASFFLLFASVSLIYGIHTNSKYLVWPWFPCIAVTILCSLAYCIMWWTGNVKGYWLVLTIIEILSVIINIYCLICIIAQYNRISNGLTDYQDYRYGPDKSRVYYGQDGYDPNYPQYDPNYDQQQFDPNYDPYKQQQGQKNQFVNDAYETDPMSRRVHIYDGYENAQGQQHFMADELPVKTPLEQPVTEEEGRVEHWLQTQDQQPPVEPSPLLETLDQKGHLKISKSAPSVDDEGASTKHRKHHKRHSSKDKERDRKKHRSSSVGSRSTKSHRRTSESSLSDSDSDADKKRKKHRERHDSKHRSSSRHRSHSRGDKSGASDTDTGYSRSERGHRHKRDKSDDERSRRHRRPRDVKRDHNERRQAERPQTSASDPQYYGQPKYSPVPYAPNPAASISIPQSIVIPAGGKGKEGQPRRYHIENSITISYSDKSSNPASEHAFVPVQGVQMRSLPPPNTSSTPPQRISFGNESMDSKGQGSQGATAV